MTGIGLIVVFLISIFALFGLIVAAKWEPFIALLVVTIGVGVATGMDLSEIPGVMTDGFGTSLAGVGILIGVGVMFGQLLGSAGAIQKIALGMLRLTGQKQAATAVAGTGALVSIPVFFDAAFIILVNLIRSLSTRAKVSMMTLTTSLAVGLIITHGVVPPTPGPIIVADNVGVSLGIFMGYGIIVSIPAIIVAGVLYAKWIGRNQPLFDTTAPAPGYDPEHGIAGLDQSFKSSDGSQPVAGRATTETKPAERAEISTLRSFTLLCLPIAIILAGAIVGMFELDNPIAKFVVFLGNPNIGLLIGLLVTAVAVRRYLGVKPTVLYQKAISDGGLVLLISGAGGAYGAMLTSTGVGDYLVDRMTAWSMPILLLGFLFAQLLRASLGNTTLALITASSVLGPLVVELGASPLLLGLAICAGGIGLSLPNDSGFWVVNKFSGLSVKDTLKTWTAGGTLAGVTVLASVYVLSFFEGVLPGL
jgi:GntP family gluconate:H+ symporter